MNLLIETWNGREYLSLEHGDIPRDEWRRTKRIKIKDADAGLPLDVLRRLYDR